MYIDKAKTEQLWLSEHAANKKNLMLTEVCSQHIKFDSWYLVILNVKITWSIRMMTALNLQRLWKIMSSFVIGSDKI